MSDGWIKLHRSLLNWEWYSDTNCFRLFVHLILTANHKDMKWRGKVIARGQKLTSRAKLSEETGLSEQEIRTALNKLKSTNELTNTSTKKETVITLCNYDTYQSLESDGNQESNQRSNFSATNKQPSSNQATNKNDKNDKKKRGARGALDLVFPEALKSEAFAAKWREYEAYRKLARFKPLLAVSAQKQIDKLATFGERVAIEAIDMTIFNQWQGIFPEKAANPKQGTFNGFNSRPNRNDGTANAERAGKSQSANIVRF